MNPKQGFLKVPHSPDEYFTKLAEELGEVAEAHTKVRAQVNALNKRASKDPKVLLRPVPQSAKRAVSHLHDELGDIIKVARAWQKQLEGDTK